MYTLIQNVGVRNALVAEVPALGSSLVVAEMFYRFSGRPIRTHSPIAIT